MSIRYAILGLLSWKPSSGYELKKVFEASSSMYWSGNNNQIYKTLVGLQDEGLVTNETEHQEGLPSKKIYTITGEGLAELKEWVLSAPELPEFKKPFLIQLAWAELLNDEELSALLTRYESEIIMQLMLQQEKMKRKPVSPERTAREAFLWQMIEENVLSSYHNELEWIQKVQHRLFEAEVKEEKEKMQCKVIESGKMKYLEVLSCEAPIGSEQDALDLIALCGESDTNLLMLHSEALSDDFFKLRTGVAGKVLQKFVNYHIKAAAVVTDERAGTGKFRDFAVEASRGNQFRVFADRKEAEDWLEGC